MIGWEDKNMAVEAIVTKDDVRTIESTFTNGKMTTKLVNGIVYQTDFVSDKVAQMISFMQGMNLETLTVYKNEMTDALNVIIKEMSA